MTAAPQFKIDYIKQLIGELSHRDADLAASFLKQVKTEFFSDIGAVNLIKNLRWQLRK